MNPVPITFDERVNDIEHLTYDVDGFAYNKDVAAGAAWWIPNDGVKSHLRFTCPCGCGYFACTPTVPPNKEGWKFDGDHEKPTLTPSIQFIGGCKWHGYLTKGEFVAC